MKKLIMLAGLLAVFNLSMAEDVVKAEDEITADVKVSATVVEPLKILEVKPVEFGLIPKGTTKVVPEKGKGKVSISGEKDRWVKLSLTSPDRTDVNILDTKAGIVLLRKENDQQTDLQANETVTYNLQADRGNREQLNANGELDINLTGSATAGVDAESTNYGRLLNFKVVYDFDNQ